MCCCGLALSRWTAPSARPRCSDADGGRSSNQPLLMKPLEEPLCGLELTFWRKPNSEKGGKDGGLRFTLSTGSQSEEAADDACGELLVTRISEGQYCDKLFSEKLILKKVTTDLAKLPVECGEVLSVVNLMDASQ